MSRSGDGRAALEAAIATAAGAAIVLDGGLRIVFATAAASELVGGAVPVGAPVVRVLCGAGEQRPIALALARGTPMRGQVMRPDDAGELRPIDVHAQPMADGAGWLLRLAPAARAAGVAVVGAVEFHGMVTADPGMKRLFHILERAAARDVSVLVRGPTGAGKELVARALHALSPRAQGPFRAINCAALPPALLESELFGHVRGAFTGAARDSPGIFRSAHGGTLLLDEVAELPLELQAKLLRVLETRTVIPVGGVEPIAVDARVIAATHQSLRAAVEAHRFRADLMYRLRVVPVFLPPLAARPGDVALLTDRFLVALGAPGGRRITRVSAGARAALDRYAWPGNVRELRSALEYAFVIGDGDELVEADLPPEITGGDAEVAPPLNAPPIDLASEDEERRRVRVALERAGGSRARAATILGVSRATLWRRMRALGLG
ncbi:MAG: sigma 54-interacting transcriptional regulator [Kofleriaceae bacterium]